MQLLKEWPPNRKTPSQKRKRESPEASPAEDERKKPRAEDNESTRKSREPVAGVEDERVPLHSPASLHTGSPGLSPAHDSLLRNNSSHSDKLDNAHASADYSKHLKPFRIDTATAMSTTDPRSPGYRRVSQAGKDGGSRQSAATQSHRKASFDSLGQESDPPSRRQSETMPPPISGTTKGLRSESSTPKASNTPTTTLPMNLAAPKEAPLAYDFSGLAQSIVLASSLHVKLDNFNEVATETEWENRRKQRYAFAHDSLIDLAHLRHEASQKAKVRLSQQFESLCVNQNVIAKKLEAQITQASAGNRDDANVSAQTHDKEELARIRKEVQAAQTDLEDLKRKALGQSDLESYDRKVVHHDDLAQFVKEEKFQRTEGTIAAHNSDLRRIGEKLAKLHDATQQHHRDIQETQKRNDTRFRVLETDLKSTQADQSRLEESLGSQRESLGLREADLNQLQKSLVNLNQAIHGNPDMSELGLIASQKSHARMLAQLTKSTEQLAEKIKIVEDEIKERNQRHSPKPAQTQLEEEIAIVRQDVEHLTKAQNEEYSFLAETVDNLQISMKECQEQLIHFTDETAKQNSQRISSESLSKAPQLNDPTNPEVVDRVKLEQLENDLKALDTQVVVQKKQFDNLTTERLAQNIIHQTKQLYKEHPGYVQDRLMNMENRQSRMDSYLVHTLEARLVHMRAAIDVIPALANRIQSLEANFKQNCEQNIQTRNTSMSFETITKRLDRLEGATESRRLIQRQDQTTQPQRTVETEVGEKTAKNTGVNETTAPHMAEAVMTSNYEDSVVSTLGKAVSASADESEGPLQNAKRERQVKRKRKSYSQVSDSQDDH